MSLFHGESSTAVARLGILVLLLGSLAAAAFGADPTITVMTRNMDAGTDLAYVLAATDEASYTRGIQATWAELRSSNFKQRAARLAEEIAATQPDLIALQEVTLWRTGPLMNPPATNVLYDQLQLLLDALTAQKLYYSVVIVHDEIDAEAPLPTVGIDLRITDRNVVLARQDLPASQFRVVSSQAHDYTLNMSYPNPVLGSISAPSGWIELEVAAGSSHFRFVNTHLLTTIPGVPATLLLQQANAQELLGHLLPSSMPVILAGDFNANAEPGPEHTGVVEMILGAGFQDTWAAAHPGSPGYTWPYFGEDQNHAGPTTPNERIDLIFAVGQQSVTSSELTGTQRPFASDHAGVVTKVRLP